MINTTLIVTIEQVALWTGEPNESGERPTTDLRWTLGPSWYQDNVDGLCGGELPPYLETPDGTLDPLTSTMVRRWATQAIADTTPYRVVGWDNANPAVPILIMEEHRLIVYTTSRVIHTGTMRVQDITRTLDALHDRDGRIAVSETNHDAARTPVCDSAPYTPSRVTTIHIPVRSVKTVDHQVDRYPVTNASPC